MLPLIFGQASAVSIEELVDVPGTVTAFVAVMVAVFLAVYGYKFGILAFQKFWSSIRKTGTA